MTRVSGALVVRVAGAIAVVGAAVVVITQRLNYWLPSAWEGPVFVVAVLAGVIGLLAIVGLFNGVTSGGVSAASGLLAILAYALIAVNLPALSSYDDDALSVAAVALGSLALTMGLSAVAKTRSVWWVPAIASATLGALLVWRVSIDRYPHYAPDATRVRHFAVVAAGIVVLVAAAIHAARGQWIRRTSAVPREPVATSAQPRSPGPPKAQDGRTAPEPPVTTHGPAVPTHVAGGETASASSPRAPSTSRLQTVATVIGIASGVVSLGREIISAVQALLG